MRRNFAFPVLAALFLSSLVCHAHLPFFMDHASASRGGIAFQRSTLDSIPIDSCHFRDTLYTDCERQSCLKILNLCQDSCYCVRIYFDDGTTLDQNLHFSPSFSMKLCFDKKISFVSYKTIECPRCEIGRTVSQASEELSNTSRIVIYPNPAQSELTFSGAPSFQGYTVQIIDLAGNVRLKETLRSNRLDIHWLSKGAYIVELFQNSRKIASRKIIR